MVRIILRSVLTHACRTGPLFIATAERVEEIGCVTRGATESLRDDADPLLSTIDLDKVSDY